MATAPTAIKAVAPLEQQVLGFMPMHATYVPVQPPPDRRRMSMAETAAIRPKIIVKNLIVVGLEICL